MQNPPRLVRDLMTSTVVTLGRNDALRSADDIMRLGRIRHLPVVDEEGNLVGIVSQRDLFHSGLIRALGYGTHAHTRALDSLDVKEAMHSEVVTVTPNAPLAEAAKLMLERKIGCVVVVQNLQVVGILTESDFVRLALEAT
ncbi:MAG: CBS domain-containing protein [Myxococcota bacterium]|jgi:CBS domain-containing membrane protein|nr:CBS domain-containing protein [Myxococcota bacterium]